MNLPLQGILESFFEKFMARYYVWVALFSVLLTAAAGGVIATKWNINSDFKELLPRSSQAAKAMEEVGDRVGSGSSLFVVIDSPDGQANRRFATDYAEALRAEPEIALAHFHNDKTFFETHSLLYVDVEDLEEVHRRIRSRIRQEKQKRNPLFVPLRKPREESSTNLIDTSDLEERYDDLAHETYKEYLESDDGYSLTIVVRFVEDSTNLTATNELLDRVRALGQQLNPTSYHPEMKLEFGGGLANRQAEYRSIVDDIQTSVIFTVLGLFLVISLYFRRVRAVGFVLTPLLMGVTWTLALAFLIFGELTTISVFIFAILMGLGLDFGIHLLNSFDREREKGAEPVEALIIAYSTIGQATFIGAFTTLLAFIVLSFAQFRGLSQFGQVAALGVALTLLAIALVLPALILTFQRIWPHEPKKLVLVDQAGEEKGWLTEKVLDKASPVALGLVAVVTILGVLQLNNLTFEENFRQISRVETPWAKKAEEPPQAEAEARRLGRRLGLSIVDRATEVRSEIDPESFIPDREQKTTGAKYTSALKGQMSSTPTLLLTDSAEVAREVTEQMEALKEEGKLDTVRSVASIYSFLPGTREEQLERLEVMEEIAETLDGENLEEILSAEQLEEFEQMRALLDVEVVDIYDLPDWTKRLFREAGPKAREPAPGEEFAFEYLVYISEAVDHMNGPQAREFLGDLQEGIAGVEADVRIGSQSYIYTAMLDEIRYDGARMLLYALLLILVTVSIFFGSAIRGLVALMPLAIGLVWMLGFIAWFGIKLDFFNVIILPVIIGIGVDDGVHFYHRYLDRKTDSIGAVFRYVGAAITMTTVTSIVGFGGLAVTDYPGLQSIGYLAIVGVTTAHLATITAMPAFLWLAEKRNWRWILPRQDEGAARDSE